MPHRRCRKASAMFLCGVITLFCWQSTIYPARGQSGGDFRSESTAKVQRVQGLEDGSEREQIIVQKGETLWSLAQKHHISLEQLTQLNHIAYPDHIRAGQKLWVVVSAVSTRQELVQEKTQTLIQAQAQEKVHTQTEKANVQILGQVKTFEVMMGEDEGPTLVQPVIEMNSAAELEAQEKQLAKNSHSSLQGISSELALTTSRGPQVPEQTTKDQIAKADLELLARVIYGEARGENFEGQVAVGAVVLNRLKDAHFPKTIKEVIYQPGAFTAVIDKQIHLTPDEEAYRAAEAALAGKDPTGGALYYFNPKTATDRWIKSRPVVKQIGNHTFSI